MMEAKNVHLLEITLLIGALERAAKGLFLLPHVFSHYYRFNHYYSE